MTAISNDGRWWVDRHGTPFFPRLRVHHLAAAARPRHDRPGNGAVTTVKVDPLLWAACLELVDGDASRLRVESETSVLVLNKSKRKN